MAQDANREVVETPPLDTIEIDLKQRELAAVLAWLVPGAGHLYQRRYAKGGLFMICVLVTYFFGLGLGEGRVVYAQWNQQDRRWQYLFQVGVGLPALPALIQNYHARKAPGEPPWLGGWMAPPQVSSPGDYDELAEWQLDLNIKFELGTLYTMIAGLLNILVIYDAYAGPMLPEVAAERTARGDPDDKRKS